MRMLRLELIGVVVGVIIDYFDFWGDVLWGIIVLFFGGGIIVLVFGLIVGVVCVLLVLIVCVVGGVYVNWICNILLMLVMFFFVFCFLILFGEWVNFFLFVVIVFGIYIVIYVVEVLCVGINIVLVGQVEVVCVIGLNFGQVMCYVVLLQVMCLVVLLMMSVLIVFMKNMMVVVGFFVVNFGMICVVFSEWGENVLVVLLWVMVIFVVLVLLFSWVQCVFENKWRIV